MKEGKNLELFATIAWTIWYCKNMIQTSNKELPIAQVLVHASQVLQDFLQVLPTSSRQNVAHNPMLVRWLPSRDSWFKVNFDGTVFRYQQSWDRSGYSQPWWPSFGLHVWNYPPPSFIRCLEALAAVRAITFAFELGFSNIVIEGDSKTVIKTLTSEEESFASFGHLIFAVRPIIDSFTQIYFSHICRVGNVVTHNLARRVNGYSVWMEDVPPHLLNVLLADFG